MTRFALMLAVIAALAACVDDVSTVEQSLCPVDDELCVQELQQRTADYAQEQTEAQLPVQPVAQVPGGCGPQNCRLDVYFPSFVVRVSCHRHDDGTIHCTSTTRPL